MMKINRIRVEIETQRGRYGVDEKLTEGLNFFASEDNTCGKSSILEGIYYGLGLEEIIGGKGGEKVLTSAYKSFLEYENEKTPVLESKVYLEISNGEEEVTIFRTAKMENRDSRLVTVYYSSYDNITSNKTFYEDMYVIIRNAATNIKGFHRYLEDFLHLELPKVPASDGKQRKLYLQLLFSCMFIEQKHGWGDIFSGMPFLGIKDAKKRVVEYILKLDTFNNEKKRESLRVKEIDLIREWEKCVKELYSIVNDGGCSIIGVPGKPRIIMEKDLEVIKILQEKQRVEEVIEQLQKEYSQIEQPKPKVGENFEQLQLELEDIENDIKEKEENLSWLRQQVYKEKATIQVLNRNLEIINNDLINNKDAAKLRELGSKLGCTTSKGICPVCQQKIDDTLLPSIDNMEVMSIDENIRHLDAQKKMLEFAKESHESNKQDMDENIQCLVGEIFTLRRLAKAIRSDIYSIDEDISEAIVYKKINIQNKIEQLNEILEYVEKTKNKLLELSRKWSKYLDEKEKVPEKKFSEEDISRLNMLRNNFVAYIKKYGYKSVVNMDEINISEETYLPVISEFDMKFDSSASDNIRGIWAYTMALMKTSILKSGNHPNVLIFDEPNQHSIIPEDMDQFLESIIELGNKCQVIVGITIKDSDTKRTIEKLDNKVYNLVTVKNKAFQRID